MGVAWVCWGSVGLEEGVEWIWAAESKGVWGVWGVWGACGEGFRRQGAV